MMIRIVPITVTPTLNRFRSNRCVPRAVNPNWKRKAHPGRSLSASNRGESHASVINLVFVSRRDAIAGIAPIQAV
jgi:hypothetical protein